MHNWIQDWVYSSTNTFWSRVSPATRGRRSKSWDRYGSRRRRRDPRSRSGWIGSSTGRPAISHESVNVVLFCVVIVTNVLLLDSDGNQWPATESLLQGRRGTRSAQCRRQGCQCSHPADGIRQITQETNQEHPRLQGLPPRLNWERHSYAKLSLVSLLANRKHFQLTNCTTYPLLITSSCFCLVDFYSFCAFFPLPRLFWDDMKMIFPPPPLSLTAFVTVILQILSNWDQIKREKKRRKQSKRERTTKWKRGATVGGRVSCSINQLTDARSELYIWLCSNMKWTREEEETQSNNETMQIGYDVRHTVGKGV